MHQDNLNRGRRTKHARSRNKCEQTRPITLGKRGGTNLREQARYIPVHEDQTLHMPGRVQVRKILMHCFPGIEGKGDNQIDH